jgi:hypothetical protein
MRDLNLPSIKFSDLERRLGSNSGMTLAYATVISREDNTRTIHVLHHGNEIARLTPMTLWVSCAGYSSSTTRDRLNAILKDNDVHYGVSQIKGRQWLTAKNGTYTQPFAANAQFIRDEAGKWELV